MATVAIEVMPVVARTMTTDRSATFLERAGGSPPGRSAISTIEFGRPQPRRP
jgi:hypothetical protein